MAATRTAITNFGSIKWIAQEHKHAQDYAEQEVDDFRASALNELDWLNAHMSDIYNKTKLKYADVFKTPKKGETPKTILRKTADTRTGGRPALGMRFSALPPRQPLSYRQSNPLSATENTQIKTPQAAEPTKELEIVETSKQSPGKKLWSAIKGKLRVARPAPAPAPAPVPAPAPINVRVPSQSSARSAHELADQIREERAAMPPISKRPHAEQPTTEIRKKRKTSAEEEAEAEDARDFLVGFGRPSLMAPPKRPQALPKVTPLPKVMPKTKPINPIPSTKAKPINTIPVTKAKTINPISTSVNGTKMITVCSSDGYTEMHPLKHWASSGYTKAPLAAYKPNKPHPLAHLQHKPNNPSHLVKVSSARIPFAGPSEVSQQHHYTPAPTAQQKYKTPVPAVRPVPQIAPKSLQAPKSAGTILGDSIELPDIMTDSEDEDDEEGGGFRVPSWAATPALKVQLEGQQLVDPESIFGPIGKMDMEDMFKNGKNGERLKQFRVRSSSAMWVENSDQITSAEKRKDRQMRAQMVKDGGWVYNKD